MKVLWLVNITLPAFARAKGLPVNVREGWLSGLFDRFAMRDDPDRRITLGVLFPAAKEEQEVLDGVTFYGFREDLAHPEHYDNRLEKRFRAVLDDFAPDLVHVFGTEFPHALAMARTYENPEHLLIGIQGICSEIALRYRADLPDSVWKRVTVRDALRRDSLEKQQEKFRVRGVREKSTLLLASHVTGRTAFDREFTRRLVPRATYHHMNETMREPFYEGAWIKENMRPHSIFVAQGDYPLKGLHFLLRILPRLVREFPDTHVFVTGKSVIKDRLRCGAYGEYLEYLITRGQLENNVTFVGEQTAEDMRTWYLTSHVFLCPSVLENSPNALGEAMLIGTPCIASEAGGIPSMLEHGKEGLLFPAGNLQALYDSIRMLFTDEALCGRLSEAARDRARITHDPLRNLERLKEIYRTICKEDA